MDTHGQHMDNANTDNAAHVHTTCLSAGSGGVKVMLLRLRMPRGTVTRTRAAWYVAGPLLLFTVTTTLPPFALSVAAL